MDMLVHHPISALRAERTTAALDSITWWGPQAITTSPWMDHGFRLICRSCGVENSHQAHDDQTGIIQSGLHESFYGDSNVWMQTVSMQFAGPLHLILDVTAWFTEINHMNLQYFLKSILFIEYFIHRRYSGSLIDILSNI